MKIYVQQPQHGDARRLFDQGGNVPRIYNVLSENWFRWVENWVIFFIWLHFFFLSVGCYSMVPVQEFFSYFGVAGFYGVNMTDVENMILYGEEIVNRPLPSVKDIVLSNEVKSTNDEFHELYKNSLLSKYNDIWREQKFSFQNFRQISYQRSSRVSWPHIHEPPLSTALGWCIIRKSVRASHGNRSLHAVLSDLQRQHSCTNGNYQISKLH